MSKNYKINYMKRFIFIISFINIIKSIHAFDDICSSTNENVLVEKGKTTYICITVNDKYRAVFMPIVDKVTELYIKSSYNDPNIGAYPNGTYLTVSSLKSKSFYKMYKGMDGKVYPVLTVIISVKKGEIQGITFDDGCFLCSLSSCNSNIYSGIGKPMFGSTVGSGETCYRMPIECADDIVSCDLTLYVVWTGTDKHGDYLKSAGFRFSQFQSYSMKSFLTNLRKRIVQIASAYTP